MAAVAPMPTARACRLPEVEPSYLYFNDLWRLGWAWAFGSLWMFGSGFIILPFTDVSILAILLITFSWIGITHFIFVVVLPDMFRPLMHDGGEAEDQAAAECWPADAADIHDHKRETEFCARLITAACCCVPTAWSWTYAISRAAIERRGTDEMSVLPIGAHSASANRTLTGCATRDTRARWKARLAAPALRRVDISGGHANLMYLQGGRLKIFTPDTDVIREREFLAAMAVRVDVSCQTMLGAQAGSALGGMKMDGDSGLTMRKTGCSRACCRPGLSVAMPAPERAPGSEPHSSSEDILNCDIEYHVGMPDMRQILPPTTEHVSGLGVCFAEDSVHGQVFQPGTAALEQVTATWIYSPYALAGMAMLLLVSACCYRKAWRLHGELLAYKSR